MNHRSEVSADVIEALKTRNSIKLKTILTRDQITISNDRFLLLHEAILQDFDNEILDLILSRGAGIDSQDLDGYAPLHLAILCSPSPERIIDFLLRRGADSKILNLRGETPHFCAVVQQQFEKALKILGQKDIDKSLYKKYFYFCASIFNCPSKATKLLRNSNFNVNFLELQGVESPLYYAVMKKDLEMVQKLLAKGAKPNRDFCLHRAIKNHSLGIVKSLIRFGANPKSLDENHDSILNVVFANADFELVDFFSKLKVNPNLPNLEGQTPLHTSCWYSCPKSVEILLKMGARVDARDSFGNTVLHYCARDDQDEGVFEELLRRDANVNARNNEGRTPLNECRRCGTMILLLRAGEVPNDSECWCQCHGTICPVILHVEKLRLLGYECGEARICGMEDQWKAELNAMKKVKLVSVGKKTVRLYDFLFMGKLEVEKYAANEILAKVYDDSRQDFENLFPHYGFLINRYYRKILERRRWAVEVDNFLTRVLGKGLPDECSDFILGHLSDKDLKILCQDRGINKGSGMLKNFRDYFESKFHS